MICVVRCPKKRLIQLPDGIQREVGASVPCPEGCIYKKNMCRGIEEFTVEWQEMKETPSGQSYTADELSKKWNVGSTPPLAPVAQEAPTPSPVASERPVPVVDERPAQASSPFGSTFGAPSGGNEGSTPSHTNSAEQTRLKYSSFGTFAPSSNRPSPWAKAEAQPSNELKPVRSYDKFIIRGNIYSDDPAVKQMRSTQPLRNALWAVFEVWDTKAVFKNPTTLQDDFVWLMTSVFEKAGTRVNPDDVNAILQNSEYSVSQKFFYLFYDVIYKYSPPNGFYWCDKTSSYDPPLISRFKNRQDFVVRYSDSSARGEAFRAFYQQHKREILHFLAIEDENEFFDKLASEIAKDTKELVLIDKYRDHSMIRLGSLDTFIKNMQKPSSLSLMNDMIAFLRSYRICDGEVVSRSPAYPFDVSKRNGLVEDQSMYTALGLTSSSNYASEYDCYVTLLREYVDTFRPDKVTVGDLTFTKANFSDEIQAVVEDLCQALFGEATDTVVLKKKGRAWLTKSLYERDILRSFHCENDEYVQKLMALVEAPTLDAYFTLFDIPSFRIGSRIVKMNEYIDMLMDDDAYTICGKFRENEVVREYFRIKIRDIGKTNMDQTYQTYQQLYDDFISG